MEFEEGLTDRIHSKFSTIMNAKMIEMHKKIIEEMDTLRVADDEIERKFLNKFADMDQKNRAHDNKFMTNKVHL